MQLIDQHTKNIMEGCKKRARDLGLSFDDETLEFIVTSQDMVEFSPKIMIPTLYDYWVHDVNVIQGKGRYSIFPNVSYETVINTRPAVSFYNDNNPDWLNVMIFYHVLGHIDFFQNNKYFLNTWKDDFMGKALADKRRINYVRQELGEKKRWVDYIIEFTRGIDNLVNFYVDLKTEISDKSKTTKTDYFFSDFLNIEKSETSSELMKKINEYNDFVKKYGSEDGDNKFFEKVKKNYPEFSSRYKKWRDKKSKKKRDLIEFLMNESPVINKEENWWMKEVMQIVRDTSIYFQPQIRTKICNEGWACIVGDSLVHTEDGFIPIIDAQEYCSKVVGIKNQLTDIGEIKKPKIFDTVKIKTNRFFNLEGAKNHRILKIENDKKVDVKLKDLQVGDILPLSGNNNIWPDKRVRIDRYSCFQKQLLFPGRQLKVSIPEYIDEDLGYLFGSLIAEGCWLGRGFSFKNSDEKYAKRIEDIIRNKFDREPQITIGKEGKIDVACYSTMTIEFMKQAGMDVSSKSHDKRVPWSILQSPKEVVASFIAGFTDGDGCIYYNGRNSRKVILTSGSEKLLEEISLLLLNMGIIGSHAYNRKKGYRDVHQLLIDSGLNIIKFRENIPLRDEKKVKLLEDSTNKIKRPRQIEYSAKITEISYGKEKNYDWEIPDGNYYSAQGFINHNSLIHQYLFEQDDRVSSYETDYALVNAKVVSNSSVGLNPYAIGNKLLDFLWKMGEEGKINNYSYQLIQNIEERKNFDEKTNKGWETLFKVRENFNDFMLINSLDKNDFQDFVTKNKLFVAGRKLNPYKRVWEYFIKSRKGEDYKQMLIDSLYHPPKIKYFSNMNDELYLTHVYEGRQLVTEYIENVLIGLEYLWGNPIKLETTEFVVEDDNKYYYWMMNQTEELEYKKQQVRYKCENKKIKREVL